MIPTAAQPRPGHLSFMSFPGKLILCVLAAWIPSYFICDFGATLAMEYISPANPLFDAKGEMAVHRGGLGLARDGELPNISPAQARAAIFTWAGTWIFKYPVETALGFVSFWWRWVAFGLAVVIGLRWASDSAVATSSKTAEPAIGGVQ